MCEGVYDCVRVLARTSVCILIVRLQVESN